MNADLHGCVSLTGRCCISILPLAVVALARNASTRKSAVLFLFRPALSPQIPDEPKKSTQALCHAMCTQNLKCILLLVQVVADINSCPFAILGTSFVVVGLKS